MTYIDQMNAFWSQNTFNPISCNAIGLYMALMQLFNKSRWQSKIQVSNITIMSMTELSEKQFRTTRAELVKAGLIKYIAGRKGMAATYELTELCDEGTDMGGNEGTNMGTNMGTNEGTNEGSDSDGNMGANEGSNMDADREAMWATYKEKDKDIDKEKDIDIYTPLISPQGETKPKRRSTKTELESVPEEQPEEPKAPETPSERRKGGKKPSDAIELTKIIDEQDEGLREPLRGFVETRKKLKKPLTPHALELSIKKLYRMSDSPKERADIVDQAVMNGWLTFYPLKNERQNEDVFTQIMREEAEKEAQYIDTDRDFTGLKAYQNCISSQLF